MVRSADALRGALLRLLDRKPFDQITIREITAEAKVHYATFFRHHATKEALLDHVASDQIDRLVALALPVQEATDYRAGFLVLCSHVQDDRKLWTALLTGGAAPAMREELLRVSMAVTRERKTADIWLPPELATTLTVSLMIDVIVWWLRQEPDAYPPQAIADMLCRLLDTPNLLRA